MLGKLQWSVQLSDSARNCYYALLIIINHATITITLMLKCKTSRLLGLNIVGDQPRTLS